MLCAPSFFLALTTAMDCYLPYQNPTLSVYNVYKIGLQDLFLLWIDGTSLRLC